jgi:hypothetical protein
MLNVSIFRQMRRGNVIEPGMNKAVWRFSLTELWIMACAITTISSVAEVARLGLAVQRFHRTLSSVESFWLKW